MTELHLLILSFLYLYNKKKCIEMSMLVDDDVISIPLFL